MANYRVARYNSAGNILTYEETDGYVFNPKHGGKIKVKKLTVVDNEMIDKILSMKFDKRFRRLVTLAIGVLENEDADEGDANIVLGEAQLVKEILENKYKKFLKHEKTRLFLEKIRVIEKQLEMKKIEIKKKAMYLEMMSEEKTSTRRM